MNCVRHYIARATLICTYHFGHRQHTRAAAATCRLPVAAMQKRSWKIVSAAGLQVRCHCGCSWAVACCHWYLFLGLTSVQMRIAPGHSCWRCLRAVRVCFRAETCLLSAVCWWRPLLSAGVITNSRHASLSPSGSYSRLATSRDFNSLQLFIIWFIFSDFWVQHSI